MKSLLIEKNERIETDGKEQQEIRSGLTYHSKPFKAGTEFVSAAYFAMRAACCSGVTESLNLSMRICLTVLAIAINIYASPCNWKNGLTVLDLYCQPHYGSSVDKIS